MRISLQYRKARKLESWKAGKRKAWKARKAAGKPVCVGVWASTLIFIGLLV